MSLIFKGVFTAAQPQPYPGQPATGPGGAGDYHHQSVAFFDHAKKADGFWLFEPLDPKPDSAHVVVFMHGYGAYNPMAYGKWIKHLVARGNIVIYPRYQLNLISPHADRFPENAAAGIRKAIEFLQNHEEHVQPRLDKVAYIGHSYGGVINANLGVNWQKMGIPKPTAMLLAQPGTSRLKGARLKTYEDLPADLNLVTIASEHDWVVGAEFSKLVFETATNTPNRNLVVQFRSVKPDSTRAVGAFHSEPYCYDLDFDTGVRNYTALRVLQSSRLDEVDFNCFWKIADALIDFTREGKHGDVAFGNTARQRSMGKWSDGSPIRELKVFLPVFESDDEVLESVPLEMSLKK